MRTSERRALVTCGLALLLSLFSVVSVSAWYDPDAGPFTLQSLAPVSPPVPDSSDHAAAALQTPCIALEKNGPDRVYWSELIGYEFTVTNCSDDADLHDVTVSDPLLGGVIWGPGILAYGQSESFVVEYRVPWDVGNSLGNTATAEGYDSAEVVVSQSAHTSATVLVPLGFKFLDQNRDGAQQPDEAFVGNWEIQLRDIATDQQYRVWTNNSPLSGLYGRWFPPKEMPAGIYDVSEVQQPGWTQTYPGTDSGGYRIEYREDGTFDLMGPATAPDYGLSFGNAQAAPTCSCPDWVVFHSNRTGNWELYRASMYGGVPARLTDDPAVDTAPAVSQASAQTDARIAFQSNRSGNWDIYRVDADGQNLLRLTTGGAFNNTDPVWTPVCDGQSLAFVSDRDGNEEIYVMNGDGSGQQRLTDSAGADTDPDWAPLGEAVAFQSLRNGNWDIYRVDVSGTNLVQLTADAADDVDPTWSPDGDWIAFHSNRSGSWQIYLMPATGGEAVRLSTGSGDNMQAVWSPTGGQLAYHSNRDGNWEIYVGDITTLAETRVTNDAPRSQAPTWSCTGDSVVYQTDGDGNWELYHVETATGLLLAHVANDPATDIYPAWAPREEDGSLLGLDIPLPTPTATTTPVPAATPTATPVPTTTPTITPGPTMTPVQTQTPIPTPTAPITATPTTLLTSTPTATAPPAATSTPTQPVIIHRIHLPVLLKNSPPHCAGRGYVVNEEFQDPSLAGWQVSRADGSLGVSGGVMHLWAPQMTKNFPLVWRNDLFAALGDEFLFEVRFHYSDLTAYGTTIALGPVAFSGTRIPASTQLPPGMASPLSIHHVVDVAAPANSRFEVVLFGGAAKWVGTAGDTDWHVVKLALENGNHYSLYVDDVYVGSMISSARPVSAYVGNPTTQSYGGQWSQIYVDYVRVSRCAVWGW